MLDFVIRVSFRFLRRFDLRPGRRAPEVQNALLIHSTKDVTVRREY